MTSSSSSSSFSSSPHLLGLADDDDDAPAAPRFLVSSSGGGASNSTTVLLRRLRGCGCGSDCCSPRLRGDTLSSWSLHRVDRRTCAQQQIKQTMHVKIRGEAITKVQSIKEKRTNTRKKERTHQRKKSGRFFSIKDSTHMQRTRRSPSGKNQEHKRRKGKRKTASMNRPKRALIKESACAQAKNQHGRLLHDALLLSPCASSSLREKKSRAHGRK